MEDELPDYDADDEDEKWLEQFNKNHPDTPVQMLDLERIFDTLEKSCSSRIDVRILSYFFIYIFHQTFINCSVVFIIF